MFGDFSRLGGRAATRRSETILAHNRPLELEWLNANVEGTFGEENIDDLRYLGSPKNMPTLAKIGDAAAKQVFPEHFPNVFQPRDAAKSKGA